MTEETGPETLESYLEDLQALASPSYLASIAEGREQYRAGDVIPIEMLEDREDS